VQAQDHAALFSLLQRVYGLPCVLDAAAIPGLTMASHAARESAPYLELVKAIEANGTIRIEAVRYPDVKTGLTGPDVLNIQR